MKTNQSLEELWEEYLVDHEKDIVGFASYLGFNCFYQGAGNISLPFLAMTIVNKQGKAIVMPNLNCDLKTKCFIIAYLLTEYSKRKEKSYTSTFFLQDMDLQIYEKAKSFYKLTLQEELKNLERERKMKNDLN